MSSLTFADFDIALKLVKSVEVEHYEILLTDHLGHDEALRIDVRVYPMPTNLPNTDHIMLMNTDDYYEHLHGKVSPLVVAVFKSGKRIY